MAEEVTSAGEVSGPTTADRNGPPAFVRRRLRFLGLVFAAMSLIGGGLGVHAWTERNTHTQRDQARAELARSLGFADLALSSSARWIRHPSQVEPMAPMSDLPASFDTDPAGAWLGPPVPPRGDTESEPSR